MTISAELRTRISALGELSRPLGEVRARELAQELINAVSKDITLGKNPNSTIDFWIKKIAKEVAEKTSGRQRKSGTPKNGRKLADFLPEVA